MEKHFPFHPDTLTHAHTHKLVTASTTTPLIRGFVTFPSHRSSQKTGVRPDVLACQTHTAYLKAQAPVRTVFWTGNDFSFVVTK